MILFSSAPCKTSYSSIRRDEKEPDLHVQKLWESCLANEKTINQLSEP